MYSMDFKVFLIFVVLFLALVEVSAQRRHRGKHLLSQRRQSPYRRNSNALSSQGQRSKFRKAKKRNIMQLLPYEAEENVAVKERMNVSLWKVNKEGETTARRRPKRETSENRLTVNNSSEKTLSSDDQRAATQEFSNTHAQPKAVGTPWPLPQYYKTDPDKVYSVDPGHFYISVRAFSKSCDTLTQALRRYYTIITGRGPSGQSVVRRTDAKHYPTVTGDPTTLTHIEVSIMDVCSDDFPRMDSNESYSLHITNTSAYIKSKEVWGLLRGLQTFSQIIYRHPFDSRQLYVNWTVISDYPRFKHRGVLIDTGRHYIHPNTIKETMDVMEQNKLNVLHWNIPDQFFPLVSKTYSQLGVKGSYSGETYKEGDVADIVEFARQRGIRVIPEFGTPGHTGSWRPGLHDATIDCDDVNVSDVSGFLDVINIFNHTVVSQLWRKLMSLFPDRSVHLGGKQVSTACWSRSREIKSFMKREGLHDFKQLIAYYTKRLTKLISTVDKNKQQIFWDDILEISPKIDKNVVVHIRRPNPSLMMTSAAKNGHRMIYSSSWYLNNVTSDRDWIKFYLAEPLQHLSDPSYWDLVIGGEARVWGKHVDNSNVLQTMWPCASAVAERLWSAPYVRNVTDAEMRLEEQRCRMIRRNIPPSQINSPSSCSQHVP